MAIGIPKYAQLAASIRERISNGDLSVGNHAPSENELVAEHRVSRATAAKALDLLARENLIERVQGTGSVVIAAPEAEEIFVAPGARIRARFHGGDISLVVQRPGRADEVHPASRAVIVTIA